MSWVNKCQFKRFGLNLILCIIIGLVAGGVGTLFATTITAVTNLRMNFPWLLYLLPLGGILSQLGFKLLKTDGMGTNQVIESSMNETKISFNLAPSIFIATALSHLFGASVGREGAALQLGGGTAIFMGDLFKRDENDKRLLVSVGMSAFFSAVFGTPLAAAFFAVEIAEVGKPNFKRLFYTVLASFVAFSASQLLGGHAERFNLINLPSVSVESVLKTALIALLCVGVAIVFCYAIRCSSRWFKALIPNRYIKVAVGGVIIIVLTEIIGNRDYNGAGVFVIERIFETGEVVPWTFLLKLLMTVVAIAAGFRGGEIVPTLFIGATFGAFAAQILGLPVAFGAAVGMTALFCCVTNCPLASFLLAAEMFSFKGLGFMLIAVVLSFVLSGRISLYTAQKTPEIKSLLYFFKKIKPNKNPIPLK